MRGMLVSCFAVLVAQGLQAAAPPGPPRNLTAEEKRRVEALRSSRDRHALAGRFEEAVRLAEQEIEFRQARQGSRHWEVTDARLEAERRRRLAAIPAADRLRLLHGLTHQRRGEELAAKGKWDIAEREYRRYLQLSLGDSHPTTGTACETLAFFLHRRGRYAESLDLLRRAGAIKRSHLGENHRDTASNRSWTGGCLNAQGKHLEALHLYQHVLTVFEKELGEDHPDTAAIYNNVATGLERQGRFAEALLAHRHALATWRKTLGERHFFTATSYNNLASCLSVLGNNAEARPMFEQALARLREALGEDHFTTASAYNNLATCLDRQGKHAEALPLFQRSLTIRQKILGEHHPNLATAYHNVATCLSLQGQYVEALTQYQRALAIRQKALGEEHPESATSYHSVASTLGKLGKDADALPLVRRALEIRQKVLGEQHPDTAEGVSSLAKCLERLGRHPEALPLHQKALAARQSVLGEHHAYTGDSHFNLAMAYYRLGQTSDAITHLERSRLGWEVGRLQAASSGFDRSLTRTNEGSPLAALAVCLVRQGEAARACACAESDLARGLLDDLPQADAPANGADGLARLKKLDQALLPLLVRARLGEDQQKHKDALVRERRDLLAALARDAADRARQRVLPLADIQRHIPGEAAIVSWIEEFGEHLGCVLRHKGDPQWVKLPGTGQADAWSRDDDTLPARALAALRDPKADDRERPRLLAALRRQRLAPLLPHLHGVKHLLVVPAGQMASAPIEAFADGFTVSYVPSGSVYARLMQQHRPLRGDSLLALGDPTYTREATPRLPGSRLEVQSLVRLVATSTTLLGSDASEQRLQALADADQLRRFRLLHLAAHGEVNAALPADSALLLAQGRLTVAAILRKWRLDADMVVLSACETGLGREAQGEGLLGFAQALLQKGARSVVLSRWRVDDAATALLMARFYENLLGKRDGLKGTMSRAAALDEAKRWLRELPRADADKRLAALVDGLPRGERGTVKETVIVRKGGDRPFAAPYYWAAFVLVGDPR